MTIMSTPYQGKGLGAIKDAANSSNAILKIKANESKVIRLLTLPENIISVWEHVEQMSGGWQTVTCLGKAECPLCRAGKQASFKSYIAIIDREDNKVKVLKASKKVGVQLIGLQEEYGDLRGRDFKISRTGDKLDTTYQFFPRDPSPCDFTQYEEPDFEVMVQPIDAQAIRELMAGGIVNQNEEQGGQSNQPPGDNQAPPSNTGNATANGGFPF
jgi:hypothetical protein